MANTKHRHLGWLACALAAMAAALGQGQTPATEVILHSFAGGPPLGGQPNGVILDSAGNLYGTASFGGLYDCGVVFKVDPAGNETVLHNFANGADGCRPSGSLLSDPAGNLYGVTSGDGPAGGSVVFMLNPSGHLTVLYTFTDSLYAPNGSLIRDSAGNLYGTTYYGGLPDDGRYGVVYRLDTAGTLTALYSFKGGIDGANPAAGVIRDSDGNLYGTTQNGGQLGFGTVFELDKTGKETVRYSFAQDNGMPAAGVIRDSNGNLYGTTAMGPQPNIAGVLYKLDPNNRYTQLHLFYFGQGDKPYSGVIRDSAGNLYGTTSHGGPRPAAGVVYKLDPSGNYTLLHTFARATDGANPYAGVVADAAGNLYGTTLHGGVGNQGVVYKLSAAAQYTVLYRFPDPHPDDGAIPMGGVVGDSAGNLYGTTRFGGTGYVGTVYKLDAAGHETVLYSFTDTGVYPLAGVTRDAAGNLYGTTPQFDSDAGVVYKLDTTGHYTVLHTFTGGADGGGPFQSLTLDAAGNLYGTAGGGASNAGVVFMLSPSGRKTVLYSFTGGPDGGSPGGALPFEFSQGGVTLDAAGNLYGTTGAGGSANVGVIYKLDSTGHETVLYSFSGGSDGAYPEGFVRDRSGNLYGTAAGGGRNGAGVVYKLDPAGHQTVLYSFTGGADGAQPIGVVLDPAGNLYGTTYRGGAANLGAVFMLDPSGHETVLHSFAGGLDGAYPSSGVIRGSTGDLFGTTGGGGKMGDGGVLFEIHLPGAQ
jgi:uncharacterized repeat protein (TIGR03803 family)